MFKAVRYLPIPRDTPPSDSAQPDRQQTLVDISLLLYILNPVATAEEEAVLRRLSTIRIAEPLPHRPRSYGI